MINTNCVNNASVDASTIKKNPYDHDTGCAFTLPNVQVRRNSIDKECNRVDNLLNKRDDYAPFIKNLKVVLDLLKSF